MDQDKLREEFEAWAIPEGFMISRLRDARQYESLETQSAWDAYQAASAGREELLDALLQLLRVFPTDSDMLEAGWNADAVNHACDAHDKARAAYLKYRPQGDKE